MESNSKPKSPRSLQYYMRTLHRILGYLVIGMVIVYSLSGIILIHRTGDMMKRSIPVEQTLAPGLDADALASALKMKSLKDVEETELTITFADGSYDKVTGHVEYVKKEVVAPFNKFIDLHKLPDAKNPHIAAVTTIFGVALLLLALTSLFMYKPRAKQFKSNMLYTAIGIVITVLLIALI